MAKKQTKSKKKVTKKSSEKSAKKTTKSENKKTKDAPKNTKNTSDTKFNFWLIGAIILIIATVLIIVLPSTDTKISPEDVIIDQIDTEEAYVYAGLPFIKEDGIWTVEIEKLGQTYVVTREYGPKEVENIPINFELNNFSKSLQKYRRYYITIDPEDENPQYLATVGTSMILTLKQVYGYTAMPACIQNSTECANKPIVTCDSEENYPVIQLTSNPETSITYRAKCLEVKGNGTDFIKAGDRIIYGWYDIMD